MESSMNVGSVAMEQGTGAGVATLGSLTCGVTVGLGWADGGMWQGLLRGGAASGEGRE